MNLVQGYRGRGKSYLRVTIFVIFLVLIIFLRSYINYIIEPVIKYLAQPMWGLRFAPANTVGYIVGQTQSKSQLIARNVELERAHVDQDLLRARIMKLEQENAKLLALVGYPVNSSSKLSYVLSSASASSYSTFLIEGGLARGFSIGAKVYSDDNVILGELVEVYEDMSKVVLYSAYGREIEVELLDHTRLLATGNGNQNFQLRLPKGVGLIEGSVLYSPGGGASIIAVVARLEESAGEAFIKVLARSPVNINSTAVVYVQ